MSRRHRKVSRLLPLVVVLVAAAGVSRAGPIPLVNGDFESPVISGPIATYAAGSTGLTGWTISAGSVDQVAPWEQAGGAQSLDLSGADAGTIFQDVATVPGDAFLLTFSLAGNPDGGPAVRQVEVSWGGSPAGTISFDVTGKTRTNMGWTTEQLSLPAATGSSTRLQFRSLTAGQFGPVIDNVAVSAVPLPAAVLAAPAALALAAILGRRRRTPLVSLGK